MTIQEAREKIASDNGHGSWNICVWRETFTSILLLDEKAAELYAQSQVNEAVNECIKLLVMFGSPNENKYLIEELKKLKR